MFRKPHPKPVNANEADEVRHDEGPKPEWQHWLDAKDADCLGTKTVIVEMRHGKAPYTVRCDDLSHRHPVLRCTAPDGRVARFIFSGPSEHGGRPGYGHKHPWSAPPHSGAVCPELSRYWPEREFRAERVEVIQAKYGRPRPPEPPPPDIPPLGWQKFPPAAPAAPPRAEREPLRTWTSPKPDSPSEGSVEGFDGDGWGDGSDIPF